MLTSTLRLSEIAGSTVELICPACRHSGKISATELMKRHGGGATRLVEILAKSICTSCGRAGAPSVTVHPPSRRTDEDPD